MFVKFLPCFTSKIVNIWFSLSMLWQFPHGAGSRWRASTITSKANFPQGCVWRAPIISFGFYDLQSISSHTNKFSLLLIVIWARTILAVLYHTSGLLQSWKYCKVPPCMFNFKVVYKRNWINERIHCRVISVNNLSGPIPAYLGNITTLRELYVIRISHTYLWTHLKLYFWNTVCW